MYVKIYIQYAQVVPPKTEKYSSPNTLYDIHVHTCTSYCKKKFHGALHTHVHNEASICTIAHYPPTPGEKYTFQTHMYFLWTLQCEWTIYL